MPLRLEAVELECAKHYDPDGMRLRVMEIEKRVLEARVKKTEHHDHPATPAK